MLSDGQRETLSALIKVTRDDGCAPTYGRIKERLGSDYARQALAQLQIKGFVSQPYGHGPYIPLRTPEGVPLRLELVEIEEIK